MSLSTDQYLTMFAPNVAEQVQRLHNNNLDLVHYTSASNALRIIRNQKVTLRNASLMNDFSEIDHGEKCIQAAWTSELGAGTNPENPGALAQLLDSISPTIRPAVEQLYNRNLNERKMDTFLLSLSEHDDETDGEFGKLSMWRAYGGRTNVALVIDFDQMDTEAESGAFTLPVVYSKTENYEETHFSKLLRGLQNNIESLSELDRDHIVFYLTWTLNALAMSTKHPGFAEEREWRVIYTPWQRSDEDIEPTVVDIQGVPQKVQCIRLDKDKSADHPWRTIPNLLKKIIIGPSESPWVLYDAFVTELRSLGMEDADSRVIVSNIPIRR